MLDVFLQRTRWDSEFGKELLKFKTDQIPQMWRAFFEVVERGEDVRAYVASRQTDKPELLALWNKLVDAYAGEEGFLGQHRIKVYVYLEMAMKAGRVETVGIESSHLASGTNPVDMARKKWEDREWNKICNMLEDSRVERGSSSKIARCPFAQVPIAEKEVTPRGGVRMTFDVSNSALMYEPGDCVKVMPRNTAEMVDKMLAVLGLAPSDRVLLHAEWCEWLTNVEPSAIDGSRGSDDVYIAASEFFARATVRPLDKNTAMSLLHALELDDIEKLLEEVRAKLHMYEAWDFLMMIQLLLGPKKKPLLSPDLLSDVFAPLQPRQYSIATCPVEQHAPSKLGIVVGALEYSTVNVGKKNAKAAAGSSQSTHRRASGLLKRQFQEQAYHPKVASNDASSVEVEKPTFRIGKSSSMQAPRRTTPRLGEHDANREHFFSDRGDTVAAGLELFSRKVRHRRGQRKKVSKAKAKAQAHVRSALKKYVDEKALSDAGVNSTLLFKLQCGMSAYRKKSSSIMTKLRNMSRKRQHQADDSTPQNVLRRSGVCSTMLHAAKVGSTCPISVVPSSRGFHMPTDPTTPMVMLALGSGVSPFVGFVKHREQLRARGVKCGEMWLFWGLMDRAQARTKMFESSIESGALNLVVSFSRENFHSEIRLAEGMSGRSAGSSGGETKVATNKRTLVILPGRGKCRLATTMLTGRVRHGVDLPQADDADSASAAKHDATVDSSSSYVDVLADLLGRRCSVYLCGPPDLLHDARRVFEVVMNHGHNHTPTNTITKTVAKSSDRSLATNWFYHLAAQNRFQYDLFSSQKPGDSTAPEIAMHEVAQHASIKDCWVIFRDRVFDITEFLLVHEGGHKILMNYAGRDMTKAFLEAHGPNNHRVEMLLWAFYLGNLAGPPKFRSSSNLNVGAGGRMACYKAWSQVMDTALELKCMVHNNALGAYSEHADAHVETKHGVGLEPGLGKLLSHPGSAERLYAPFPEVQDILLHEYCATVYFRMYRQKVAEAIAIMADCAAGARGASTVVDKAAARFEAVVKLSMASPPDFAGPIKCLKARLAELPDAELGLRASSRVTLLVGNDAKFFGWFAELAIAATRLAANEIGDPNGSLLAEQLKVATKVWDIIEEYANGMSALHATAVDMNADIEAAIAERKRATLKVNKPVRSKKSVSQLPRTAKPMF